MGVRALGLAVSSLVIGCVAMSAPTTSGSYGLYLDQEEDTNRLGSDYSTFELPTADPDLCAEACVKDARCKAFTYVKPGWQGASARCWLKEQVPGTSKHTCCISGLKP
jgi:hypothetical protein